MKNRKVCFIVCTNDDTYYNECANYISRLIVPDGFEIDILEIRDAKSMTSGYNEAMNASDASIKVYLHQDTFIVYPYFIEAIVKIFESDPQIGMIGVVGAPKLPVDFVMWHSERIGTTYIDEPIPEESIQSLREYRYELSQGLFDVEAIDGLIMITSQDIPWRDDIITGWDFYDVSQTMEMKKAGFRTVVPTQLYPWCLHDSGILNFRNYEKYRAICENEYSDLI